MSSMCLFCFVACPDLFSYLRDLFKGQKKDTAVPPQLLNALSMLNLFVQAQPRMYTFPLAIRWLFFTLNKGKFAQKP